MKRFMLALIVPMIAVSVLAKDKVKIEKIIKADTSLVIKLDTITKITYDTIIVQKVYRDTSFIVKVDTIKPAKVDTIKHDKKEIKKKK